MRVKVKAKLVVGYWEFTPTESGADNSAERDTSTVTKQLEEPVAKRKRDLCWKEENWSMLNKDMEIHGGGLPFALAPFSGLVCTFE